MGERTGIAWTGATWNPWHGCVKVSPGCKHCYMYREKERYGQDPTDVRRSKTTFKAPLTWRDPQLVFTCSWSDFFIDAADDWRDDAWAVIRATPQHTYQILTKRPERILDHLPRDWGTGWRHVWLGVSVESMRYRARIADLLEVPAAGYFVSAEPLIAPVSMLDFLTRRYRPVGWVIAGGESGPGHRPMELDWARTLRDECQIAGVPFFLKQLGGWPDARADAKAILDGRTHVATPDWGVR